MKLTVLQIALLWLVAPALVLASGGGASPLGDAGFVPVVRTAGNPSSADLADDLDPYFSLQSWIDRAVGVQAIAAFRYDDGDWSKVPFQVDERENVDSCQFYDGGNPCQLALVPLFGCELTYVWPDHPGGVLTGDDDGDGVLDANDEIAFMAFEAGVKAPRTSHPTGVTDTDRYELELLTDNQAGYLYLYVVGAPAYTPADHYLDVTAELRSFDPANCANASNCPGEPDPHPVIDDWTIWEGRSDHPNLTEFETFRIAMQSNWNLRELQVRPAGHLTWDVSQLLDTTKWRGGRETSHHWNQTSSKMGLVEGPVRSIRGSVGAASGLGTTRYVRVYPTLLQTEEHVRVHPIDEAGGFLDMLAAVSGPTSSLYRESPSGAAIFVDSIDGTGIPYNSCAAPRTSAGQVCVVDEDCDPVGGSGLCPGTPPLTLPPPFLTTDPTDYYQVNLPVAEAHLAFRHDSVPSHQLECEDAGVVFAPVAGLVYADDSSRDETAPIGGVTGGVSRPLELDPGSYGSIGFSGNCAAAGGRTRDTRNLTCEERDYHAFMREAIFATDGNSAELADRLDRYLDPGRDPIVVWATHQPPPSGGGPCLQGLKIDKGNCGLNQSCHVGSILSTNNCLGGTLVGAVSAVLGPSGSPPITGVGFERSEPGSMHVTVLNGVAGVNAVDNVVIRLNGAVLFDATDVTSNVDFEERVAPTVAGVNLLEVDNLTETTGVLTLLLREQPLLE